MHAMGSATPADSIRARNQASSVRSALHEHGTFEYKAQFLFIERDGEREIARAFGRLYDK